jgi:hypothetical protein
MPVSIATLRLKTISAANDRSVNLIVKDRTLHPATVDCLPDLAAVKPGTRLRVDRTRGKKLAGSHGPYANCKYSDQNTIQSFHNSIPFSHKTFMEGKSVVGLPLMVFKPKERRNSHQSQRADRVDGHRTPATGMARHPAEPRIAESRAT